MRIHRSLSARPKTSHPSESVLAEYYCLRVLEIDTESQAMTKRLLKRSPIAAPLQALHRRANELKGAQEAEPEPDADGFIDDFDVSDWDAPSVPDSEWTQAIHERLALVEAQLDVGLEGCFFANCHRLAESLEFTPVEESMFVFLALCINHPALAGVVAPAMARTSMEEVVGALFELSEDEIRLLREEESPLFTTGVVCSSARLSLDATMPALAPMLASRLLQHHESLRDMLESILHKPAPPELSLDDFAHLGTSAQVLRGLVEGALETHAKGVNVLLHGPPGTGKTQLVRALAASLEAELVEISVSTDQGRTVREPVQRLSSLRFVQRIVSNMGRYIVLFDEAEDLFPVTADGEGRFERHHSRPAKGFMNEALESTPTVTLWTSNARGQVDPSHLRRMHLVLRIDVPPQSVRAKMVAARLGELGLPQEKLDALSTQPVTPAEIDRLGRVVELTRGVEPGVAFNVALATSESRVSAPTTATEEPSYDANLCDTDHDLEAIAQGLRTRGRGRLLLHGAPGTGKTAWVRFLAQRLERPLTHVAASSLLSKFVGETEGKMAELFARAATEKAVLFFDEADTFLSSRERAVRSWEVSMVNELLLQMERFDGVFVCATNMLDVLDLASLRRFDIKVRFGALREADRIALFEQLAGKLDLGTPSAVQRRSIRALDGLVLGDFASISRQAWFTPGGSDVEWLVEGLASELRTRGEGGARLGF